MTLKIVEKTELIPQKLRESYRDIDGIIYRDSRLLVGEKNGEEVAAIRIALRDDTKIKHGLISDLNVSDTALREDVIDLIQNAVDKLVEKSVTRINAIVLDGKKFDYLFYDLGFWPSRKSVVLSWDLLELPKLQEKPENYKIQLIKSRDFDDELIEELSEFVFNSYQPYWRWWKEHKEVYRWWRTEYDDRNIPALEKELVSEMKERLKKYFIELKSKNACVVLGYVENKLNGVCDAIAQENEENMVIGVAVSKNLIGKHFGSYILLEALKFLRENGLKSAYTITTSGLDDYDPTVYLYTLSGKAAIIAEYNILVKNVRKEHYEEKIIDIGEPLKL